MEGPCPGLLPRQGRSWLPDGAHGKPTGLGADFELKLESICPSLASMSQPRVQFTENPQRACAENQGSSSASVRPSMTLAMPSTSVGLLSPNEENKISEYDSDGNNVRLHTEFFTCLFLNHHNNSTSNNG